MDGVILDSEPVHFAAFQSTLKNYGYELSHAEYLAHFAGRTDREGFTSFFESINESIDIQSIMSQKMETYLKLAKHQLVAYPGIVLLIKQLAATVPLALVTGSLRAEATVALETLGISDCFQVMVCAEDVTNGKPDPEGYRKAQRLVGIPADHCVVVEDSPSGVRAAKEARIDCIAVTNTHGAEELQDATVITNELAMQHFAS